MEIELLKRPGMDNSHTFVPRWLYDVFASSWEQTFNFSVQEEPMYPIVAALIMFSCFMTRV